MKICPKCKAELDDNARFCLSCMTSLDEKTQIPQPVRKRRLWPFVLAFAVVVLCATLIWRLVPLAQPSMEVPEETGMAKPPVAADPGQPEPSGTQQNVQAGADIIPGTTPATGSPVQYIPVYPQGGAYVPNGTTAATTPTSGTPTTPSTSTSPSTSTTPSTPTTAPTTTPTGGTNTGTAEPTLYTWTYKGVTYMMRQATAQESPKETGLILIDVQGTSSDGTYYTPLTGTSASGSERYCRAIADGAFDSVSNLRFLEVSFNIEYIWGDAFGGNALERLHFESNVKIHVAHQAFSGCPSDLLIVSDVESVYDPITGLTWKEQAANYGFIFMVESIPCEDTDPNEYYIGYYTGQHYKPIRE